MNNTFYPQNDYREYLSHHGIKGQHWGEKNGPPYPLSQRIHNAVVRGKQKRAEKRRSKILHDPKKLTKHASEFTKEEIDAAVSKIDSINQAKSRIKQTKRDIKNQAKQAAKEQAIKNKAAAKQKAKDEKKLTKKMEKYGQNAKMLEKNAAKFTPSELNEALKRVQTKQNVFNAKIDELNRPKKYLDLGLGYVGTAIDAVKKFSEFKSLITPKYDENGMTAEDRMRALRIDFIEKNKDDVLAKAATIGDSKIYSAYKDRLKRRDDYKKDLRKSDQSEKLKEAGEAIKDYKSQAETYKKLYKEERERSKREIERANQIAAAAVQNVNGITKDQIDTINEYLYAQEEEMHVIHHSDILNAKMSDVNSTFYGFKKKNELAHHGIKGQMWGVKNGPPYPLDQKTHNRVKGQKNAKVGSFLDFEDADVFNPVSGAWYPSSRLHQLSKDLFKNNDDHIGSSLSIFTERGSRGLPVHALKKGAFDRYDNYNENEYRLDVDTIKKVNPLRMPQYFDDNSNDYIVNQLKNVNPGYKRGGDGVRNNCAKCSAALTLKKMGYNQVQAGISLGGAKVGAMQNWFVGGVSKKTNDLNDIAKALKEAKPGSFGSFGCGRINVYGERVGGHQMSWTKTRNGKIRIEDGQDGKIYDSFEEVVRAQNFSSGTVATFSDLTNAKPNWSALATDGVVQLPGNRKIVDSFGDVHPLHTWDVSLDRQPFSRENYSVLNPKKSDIFDVKIDDLDF